MKRALGIALVACGLVTLRAQAADDTETYRLVSAFHGDEVAVESAVHSAGQLRVRVDATAGHHLWDVTADLESPTVARRIVAVQYEAQAVEGAPVLHVVATLHGDHVTVTTTDARRPGGTQSHDEAMPEDAVFLPRGIVGADLLIREARARGLASRTFTWIDPTFRTETGELTFPDPIHAHVHIANAMAGQPDDDADYTIDAAGRIQTGETTMGLSVHRSPWTPAPGERIGVDTAVVPRHRAPHGGGR